MEVDGSTPTLSSDDVFGALRRAHDLLVGVAGALTTDQLTGSSYAKEWTIADVLSHLGSGAEIFTLFVPAGASGDAAPEFARFQAIWDVWNAKSPEDQLRDSLASDGSFLDAVEALTPGQRATWRMPLFGADQDLAGLLRMRLSEHTLHTWDVAVAIDPGATLPDVAAALLLDGLDAVVTRSGRASELPLHVSVQTTRPQRRLDLDVDADGARLTPVVADADPADLTLPAEALIRLVSGRLDPAHTPLVEADGLDLDALRNAFPGY